MNKCLIRTADSAFKLLEATKKQDFNLISKETEALLEMLIEYMVIVVICSGKC